jgi:hypothetical protein
MRPLSTPDEEEAAPARPNADPASAPRWLDRTVFVVVPVALALVFVAVLVGERTGVDEDLQLVAPASAAPGGAVALRAVLFTDLGRIEGARMVQTPVRVELLAGDRVASETELAPSNSAGMEGTLRVPDDVSGRARLVARATFGDGREARVEAPLTVEDPPRPVGEPGRALHPLQRYTLFPVSATGESPPAALEPRVVGGACVPEQRCEILVHVGAPAAEVTFADSAALTVETGPEPAGATAGFVRFEVVTHGPDVQAELVATRDGVEVARRALRLPIMLGGLAMRVGAAIATAPAEPRLAFSGVEAGRAVIVDAYRDGVWERTGSVPADAAAAGEVPIPFAPLEPGTWRLQARTDPWGTNSAAVRFVEVIAPSQTERDAVASAAAWVRREQYDPAFARIAPSSSEDARDVVAFLVALPELDVLPQPVAMSGHMQATWGVDEKRAQLRWGGLVAFLLAGLFVAAVVFRRGLSAAAQARAVLAAAGDEEAQTARTRRRMTATVVAVVTAIALLFVAAAMMVVARGGNLG